jgi:4-hydroxy-tetrahydrodipicolinate synthase
MFDVQKLRGTVVALVTPLDSNKQIDEQRLRKLVDWQIEQGTNVLLACGTTGESATMSHEEHHRVMDIVISQANGRVPVICGAGSNATHEAIDLSRYAEKVGGQAVLSVCPYYNKPTQEGLYQHFKAIAESINLPLIVYNVPGRTGVNLAPATLMRLAQVPGIIGVKEASGNITQIMEILRIRPKDFLVFSGDDAITLPIMAVGADGVISVVANETPRLLRDMVWSAFNGDWRRAQELHHLLLPLMEMNFIESNPIPVKTAMAMMGLIDEQFRLPLVPMAIENKEKLRKCLVDLKLI